MNKQFEIYSEVKAGIHYEELEAYYNGIQRDLAICSCAQLMDTHTHSETRFRTSIQNHILYGRQKPFVFIICLN